MNGARGTLKAQVSTPMGTDEDVYVTEIDDDRYALRFLPKENGVYYVHIKLNEAHIPGSPLALLVGKLGADPALVFARGDGLEKAESGDFWHQYFPPVPLLHPDVLQVSFLKSSRFSCL